MYLHNISPLPLLLCSDGKGITIFDWSSTWCTYSAQGCEGHWDIFASMGKGALVSNLNKTNLNTTSSTETKIVVVTKELHKWRFDVPRQQNWYYITE